MSAIADFAKLLALFFSRYLMQQRQVSPNTIASYRDTFRLLVNYANKVLGKPPQDLSFEDLDADFIGDFLNHLEHERGNDVRTLRHSAAMELLHNGVDRTTIALWLGHESVETTYIYLHADLELKERAMARTTPAGTPMRRYEPQDNVLAFLNSL